MTGEHQFVSAPLARLVSSRHSNATRDRAEVGKLAPLTRGTRPIHFLTLVSAGVFLIVEASRNWFFLDEWDFLAYRGVHLGRRGIFYPHNEHWVTIPLLVWRGIFNIVGVRDYWLYA